VIVIALFVVSTVLLLGVIHPSTSASGSASSPSVGTGTNSSTTTTKPNHSPPTTTTVPTSRVPVVVANASGVNGAAAAVTAELKPSGWNLLAPTNATAQETTSHVYYLAGFEPEARAIATTLQLPATAVIPYTTAAPINSIGTAQVLVVVGPDLANKFAPAATTATTAG
jgi:cytoskeletal protein RodZ